MATQEQIDAARRRLEAKWQSEGECRSCGWHAALYEHRVDDDEIAEALDHCGGLLELGCRSRDHDDAWGHRGVRIQIDD